ncbi:hypothetical protein ACIRJP_42265, partial [Streptomyces sp. NPDC102437]
LDSCIGHRNHPSMPVDHAAAPGNSKIPDRVKLMLSVDQIATVTGAEPATVRARLAAARREQISRNDG